MRGRAIKDIANVISSRAGFSQVNEPFLGGWGPDPPFIDQHHWTKNIDPLFGKIEQNVKNRFRSDMMHFALILPQIKTISTEIWKKASN